MPEHPSRSCILEAIMPALVEIVGMAGSPSDK